MSVKMMKLRLPLPQMIARLTEKKLVIYCLLQQVSLSFTT